MGFLKKIFRGKKEKKQLEAGAIGSPSFPSATASESRSGRKGKTGSSPSASISTNGSNAINNKNASNNLYRYNSNSPNPTGDLSSPRGTTGPVDIDDDGIIIPKEAENVKDFYERARNQTQEELRIAYEASQSQNRQNPSISSDGKLASASSSGDYDDSLNSSPGLTSKQLQQWDRNSDKNPHQERSSSPPSQQLQQEMPSLNTQPQRIYTMSSALPSQQRKLDMDDTVQSESDASSFNLSTDAEDSEYEYMKRTTTRYPQGNLNAGLAGLSALDTSAIDTVGSITSYTTDQDSKIFPNLPTDDEMTLGTEASSKTGQPLPPSLLLQTLSNPLQTNQVSVLDIDDTIDSSQGATASSSTANNISSINTSNDSSISRNNAVQKVRQNGLDPLWTDFASDPTKQPASANNTNSISRNKPGGTPRNFTSPKSTASTNTDYSSSGLDRIGKGEAGKPIESKKDGYKKNPIATTTTTAVDDSGFAYFGNFADFSGFPSTEDVNQAAEWATVEEKKDSSWENQDNDFFDKNSKSTSPFGKGIDDPAWNVDISSPTGKNDNRDDPFYLGPGVGSSNYLSTGSSSGFPSPHDTSLTELLEAAKSKRKDRRSLGNARHGIRGASSVNSAPSITSSYLRKHHNLGSNSHHNEIRGRGNASQATSYGKSTFSPEKVSADGTVSDIINSLEATDRMKRVEQMKSNRSMGDADVVATARAAKERLRERRRREREAAAGGGRNPSIRQSTSRDQSDSDESDGQKESWLFDQVTGAIGPVGITADLESLSGRSNRSKNSHGGKSNKASLSSNRRRSTRSRRHRSDRSVDSHNSRTSRYSHRSTKSFLSQMSEQSRSVANDLLRLEMQLAMVGNNNNAAKDADGNPMVGTSSSARISSAASLGGGSRASARSSGRKSTSGNSSRHAASTSSSSVVRRSKTTIVAPPGKLGIILANKADSKGTVVSGVRTSSVLVDRISPGDRIVAIDGEDVSRMTVSEITTIMSRKAEYERRLTVLTATAGTVRSNSDLRSPTRSRSSPRAMSVGGGDYGGGGDRGFSTTGSLSSYRR
mmetsp:Transcript_11936/g.28314  ORF Transcript_11936/g.28314 Transcript_11936/m.28314 type:complete len:1052 (-) Transcript_11936:394-3549(-)|eukprot:CAMPEP_0197178204 /NCGR_PEP_ID=MMETSP1423-20130617/3566_1 /TAXON_ID=476441 /ORGANISM="Pseudo-nitzschia heimii, Strain UNC1101" /LENGTH=1051 /DNA_ID=CAMNT_0042627907 /DNA_START=34 /DNA_END=3189 /DNA_ORIENTATION=-